MVINTVKIFGDEPSFSCLRAPIIDPMEVKQICK